MVKKILADGAAQAGAVAVKTMKEVRDAVGLTNTYSFFNTPTISLGEFARVELRVGKVLEAINKDGSEKLIRLSVDFGDEKPRIIFTGVRGFGYTPDDFAGKQFFFITNLAPRKMMDEESQGMILAVDGSDKKPVFVSAEGMPVGATIQ